MRRRYTARGHLAFAVLISVQAACVAEFPRGEALRETDAGDAAGETSGALDLAVEPDARGVADAARSFDAERVDAGPEPDATPRGDVGLELDLGLELDMDPEPDARPELDAAPDLGVEPDAAVEFDAAPDLGVERDAAVEFDAAPDLGAEPDAAVEVDAAPDLGAEPDAAVEVDAAPDLGVEPDAAPDLGLEPDAAPAPDAGPFDPCPPPNHDDGLGGCALPGECADDPEVDLAPGGFCVRIQRVELPEGWTGVWAHGAARLLDGTVMIAGGAHQDGPQRAAWLFAPDTDTIERAPDLNRDKRSFPTVRRRDGALLLFMGDRTNATDGFGDHDDNRTHRWDGERWHENPPAKNNRARSHAAAVQLGAEDPRVVVAGGYKDGAPQSDAQLFADDDWTAVAPLLRARAAANIVALDARRALVFGGVGADGSLFAPEVIDFDDDEPAWAAVEHPEVEGGEHAFAGVTTAFDGQLYVSGGLDEAGALDLFLRFTPGEMRWARLPDLPEPIGKHTLVALPDGRLVLMGGGVLQNANEVSDRVRVYTPGQGWALSRPLLAARREHTATVLEDGRILVVGGYEDGDSGAVPTVEIHTITR